jgi:hypothetical protein
MSSKKNLKVTKVSKDSVCGSEKSKNRKDDSGSDSGSDSEVRDSRAPDDCDDFEKSKSSRKPDLKKAEKSAQKKVEDAVENPETYDRDENYVCPSDSVVLFKPFKKNADVAKNKKMIRVLKKITNNLFDPMQFNHWDNVCIAGGYVVDLLFDLDVSSDVDLYIYGTKKQSTIDQIAKNVIDLTGGKIVCETKGVMTLRTKKGRSVQVINATHRNSIEEILEGFDIEVCKVAFDGYQIIYGMQDIKTALDGMICYPEITIKNMTIERIAKYVHKKHFGFVVSTDDLKTIDPLYFFRDSNGLNKFLQLTKLYQDATLQNIYKMIVIRKNFSSENLNRMVKFSKNDRMLSAYEEDTRDGPFEGKSLRAPIKDIEIYEKEQFNQFGQPILFEKIRKGDYKTEELYDQHVVDMCGFNVTCMMVMYEPDEDVVIAFLKDIYKVGSKNMNKYKLDYLTLASLLNRLKLVTYLMNAKNYKRVMEIAVKEDNLDLYRLAYCTHSSKDRYLYGKDELLKYKAYSIYRELYDSNDLVPELNQEFTLENEKSSDCLVAPDTTNEQLLQQLTADDGKNKHIIMQQIVKHAVKTIEEVETKEYRNQSMTDVENVLYKLYLERINKKCSIEFNRMLRLVTKVSEYTKLTTVRFENPVRELSLVARSNLVKIYRDHKLDADYKFDNQMINDLIVYMDDPEMIRNTPFKRFLMDVLIKEDLGDNLKKYVDEHLRKTNDPTLYSEILSNNMDHDSAYKYSILRSDYARQENAIGYTPCDIIIYQTLQDYVNNYGIVDESHRYIDPQYSSKYLTNRRNSVRSIRYDRKITNYTDQPNQQMIEQLLPELFVF